MSNEIEKVETPSSEESLIVVKQLPIIEEQLLVIKERFSAEVEDALSLVCTEETLQTIKKKRTEITRIFNYLESKRKEAKKAILAPYEAFEKVYKECVTEIYSPCDKQLAEKIREVEEGLKLQKRAEAETYFNEYAAQKGIDFLTFDSIGLNITMSVSKKSLKEQAKAFVDKIAEELSLIDTQEHKEEILVEYKSSLNVAQAITVVTNRHKAIEDERKKAEELKVKKEDAEKTASTVNDVLDSISAPTAEPEEKTVIADEDKRYSVSFKVIGTMEQIKALKDFLVKGEYEYEQQ